jgi:hypothetical protein
MSAGSWLFSLVAAKTTPEDWLKYHRTLRDLGTYAVIIGVIVETLIDELWEIKSPPLLRGVKATTPLTTKAARWKKCLMLFFGVVLVGGGISVEIWQGGKADDVGDDIRRNLELTALDITPRVDLLESGRAAIISSLKPFSGQKVDLVILDSPNIELLEQQFLSVSLHHVLNEAGWRMPNGEPILPLHGDSRRDHQRIKSVTGILIEYDADAPLKVKGAAEVLSHELATVFIASGPFSLMRPAPLGDDKSTLIVTIGWKGLGGWRGGLPPLRLLDK